MLLGLESSSDVFIIPKPYGTGGTLEHVLVIPCPALFIVDTCIKSSPSKAPELRELPHCFHYHRIEPLPDTLLRVSNAYQPI